MGRLTSRSTRVAGRTNSALQEGDVVAQVDVNCPDRKAEPLLRAICVERSDNSGERVSVFCRRAAGGPIHGTVSAKGWLRGARAFSPIRFGEQWGGEIQDGLDFKEDCNPSRDD